VRALLRTARTRFHAAPPAHAFFCCACTAALFPGRLQTATVLGASLFGFRMSLWLTGFGEHAFVGLREAQLTRCSCLDWMLWRVVWPFHVASGRFARAAPTACTLPSLCACLDGTKNAGFCAPDPAGGGTVSCAAIPTLPFVAGNDVPPLLPLPLPSPYATSPHLPCLPSLFSLTELCMQAAKCPTHSLYTCYCSPRENSFLPLWSQLPAIACLLSAAWR